MAGRKLALVNGDSAQNDWNSPGGSVIVRVKHTLDRVHLSRQGLLIGVLRKQRACRVEADHNLNDRMSRMIIDSKTRVSMWI